MQYDCRRQLFSTLMAVLLLLPALGVQAQDSAPSDHGNYALKPVTEHHSQLAPFACGTCLVPWYRFGLGTGRHGSP